MILLILCILLLIYKHFKYDDAYSEIDIYMNLIKLLNNGYLLNYSTHSSIVSIFNIKNIFHKLSRKISMKRKLHFTKTDISVDYKIKIKDNDIVIYCTISSFYYNESTYRINNIMMTGTHIIYV